MVTNFIIHQGNLEKISQPHPELVWIDLLEPTQQEREQVEKQYKISLPLHHEMHQIEYSNRFYTEADVLFMSIHVVTKAFPLSESHVITLILMPTSLITLRYSEPNPIKAFMDKALTRPLKISNHYALFLHLIEAIAGNIADIFEMIGERTDTISLMLIRTTESSSHGQHSVNLNSMLKDINNTESLLSKAHQSLSNLSTLMTFVEQSHLNVAEQELIEHQQIILKDLKGLLKHAEFVNQKLSFQLQSTLGQINIEQTDIIKIFTVLAMVFMPPTLIASIYGMNFQNMPELKLVWGYPFAIVCMIATAYLPYRFFKKRGWI